VLYFTASNSANGRELWKLDASTGEPVLLRDIQQGSGSSNPGNLTYSGGRLYFTADNGINGVELWTVDADRITSVGSITKTADEDQSVRFTTNDLASAFTSTTGNALTKIRIINLPSNGLLKLGDTSVLQDQEINAADLGSLIFTPSQNYNGPAGFTWNGSDGVNYAANPSTVAITINPVNDSPIVSGSLTTQTIFSNRSTNFSFSPSLFIDPDLGDSLSYSARLTNGNPFPAWINLSERSFTANPLPGLAGTYELTLIATDRSGSSASVNFSLNVVNSAPSLIQLTNSSVLENSAAGTLVGELSALDSNLNDTHQFSLLDDALGRFTVDGNRLVVANGTLLDYETSQQHSIRIKAIDNTGLSFEQQINISVGNVVDDNAGQLSFAAASFTIDERDSGFNAVTILRSNGSEGRVSCVLNLSEGTALFPADFNSRQFVVEFEPGVTSRTVTLPIVHDTISESPETILLTLSSPTGGAVLGSQQSATITIQDAAVLSFAAASFRVSEDGTPLQAITINRSGNLRGSVSASLQLTSQSAIAGIDYQGNTIAVTFAEGEASKVIAVPIVNDNILERDEALQLALVNPQGYAVIGAHSTATLTIVNDDSPQPGTLNFSRSEYTVNENGNPVASVTVVRSGGQDGVIGAVITFTAATATAPTDLAASPIQVDFADGETTKTIPLSIINDSDPEPIETFSIQLESPSGGATIGATATARISIIDDDGSPGSISFANTSFEVNEDGTPAAVVQLIRTGGQDGAVSVRLNLTDDTATAGNDYTNTPITVNFADGQSSSAVSIPIINDSIPELSETIRLSLSNPTGGATVGSGATASISILDNDTVRALSLSFAGQQVQEGQTVLATVSRNGDRSAPLQVTLVNSTPSQLTVPSAVTIPAGEASISFQATVIDDSLVEAGATYSLLATAEGYSSGSASLAVSMSDAVVLAVSITPESILEKGGMATLTVSRAIVTPTPLVVLLSGSDSSEALVPASLTIPANEASASVDIRPVDDALVDGTQTVTITARPTYTNTTTPLPDGAATTNLQILDDESASLTLTLDRSVIGETGTAAATVRRNTDTTAPLTVTLISSDSSEAVAPATVTIAAGEAATSFTVSGVNDGVSDGSQSVTITAGATGFNSGSAALDVSDIDVPDLVISQLTGVGTTYTRGQSQLSYSVRNNGISSAQGRWIDRVYLSTDQVLDNTDTLLGSFPIGSEENPATLLPGVEFSRTITYFAPAAPGTYYLIAEADSNRSIDEGAGSGEANNITVAPISITPAYRGLVSTDSDKLLPGDSVVLRGQALSNKDNTPVAFEFVKIQVQNKGTLRELDAFTDGSGNFVRQFAPIPGEGGDYTIKAYFPTYPHEDALPEDSFTLLGMQFEQNNQQLSSLNQRITEGTTVTGTLALQNLSSIALSGLSARILDAPSEWNVQFSLAQPNLPGNAEIELNYSITVPDDKWSTYTFGFDVTSAEGLRSTLPVRVDVNQLLPKLVADQSTLQASMLRGGQSLVEFQVRNEGVIPSGPLELRLPNVPYLKAASPLTIPSLGIGDSTTVTLLLQAAPDLDLTVYNGSLVVAGAEASLNLPFSFRAVSEAVGSLELSVVDELFFYTEGSPTLANATISLVDPFTGKVIFSELDADGLLTKRDLPEGYYTLRITADNHERYDQNFYLEAGKTERIQAFLSRQTVRYTWTVTPTEIHDRYTISIESVFETNVPVPTVVIEPAFIDLERLQVVGQVMQIDVKVTNHGLIAANDINLFLGEHPFYRIEPLVDTLGTLAAKSSITVPMRITRVADFDTLSTSGSGLSTLSSLSVPCSISAGLDYSYESAR
jgi:ELWxxDGT repeat protein